MRPRLRDYCECRSAGVCAIFTGIGII